MPNILLSYAEELLRSAASLHISDTKQRRVELEKWASAFYVTEFTHVDEYIRAHYPELDRLSSTLCMADAIHDEPTNYLFPPDQIQEWVDVFVASGELGKIADDTQIDLLIDPASTWSRITERIAAQTKHQ